MKKLLGVVGLVVILSMLSTTLAMAQEPGKVDEAWYAKAAEPYKGVTITGVSESTPPSKYAAEVLGPAFEKMTGIKVQFEVTSWDQMYDKSIKDMAANTGIYDFVYTEQDIVYQYMVKNYLVDLNKMITDHPELVPAGFSWDNFVAFINYFRDPTTKDYMGVPMESFLKTYTYRKDLFDDPKIKDAFKAKYGYDIAPATTFQQYQDIADFFTQYGKDNNLELWGSTLQAHTGHASSFYEVFENIMPSWGVYNWGINLDTWKACVANGGQMNSDRAKEALSFWVGLLKDAPPESTSSTWDEVAATMAAGRAAQGWVYGENVGWIDRDETRSKVVGKVAVALPPMYPGVLDDAKAGKGYVGYYDGGAYAIPYSSKNQTAAFLWLMYISEPAVQPGWALAGSRITLKSTLDDPQVQAVDAQMNGFFAFYKEYSPLFAGAPPFPMHSTLVTLGAPYVWKTITGELKPGDALDQMCAALETEMVKEGYGK
jgi:multiple sugar transport system substrate-binding protein